MQTTNRIDKKNSAHIQLVTAWLVSWAVTTYLSALARSLSSASEIPKGLIRSVFATADAVAPTAKLTLGFTLAALFWVVRSMPTRRSVRGLFSVAGSVVVFACVTLVVSTSYYAEFTVAEFWPWHAAAAAAGGAVLLRGCQR